MFTIDARCSRCTHRLDETPCAARPEIITALSELTGRLNTAPLNAGTGDGVIIVACNDFVAA